MFRISDFIDAARVVQDGKQRDDFDVCSGLLSQSQAILQNSCPVRNAVVAAERQGVVFKDGVEDWLEVHAVILPELAQKPSSLQLVDSLSGLESTCSLC